MANDLQRKHGRSSIGGHLRWRDGLEHEARAEELTPYARWIDAVAEDMQLELVAGNDRES